MTFNEYQTLALGSEQKKDEKGLIISLLGLAGEAGELLTAYKKYLRDGEAHQLYNSSIREELGDLLWYLANTASKFNLSLDEIANANLVKVKNRWISQNEFVSEGYRNRKFYDSDYPASEQFQRSFTIEIRDSIEDGIYVARSFFNGEQIGDLLTDNSYHNDGYRFHDVFHLTFVAVLGWSPVFRKNIKQKRRSNTIVNEVEDGGRAAAIEEGISALIFVYAKSHNWLEGIVSIDDSLLKTVMCMVTHLEVRDRTAAEWERAILKGFEIWRQVVKNSGGRITVDMTNSEIGFDK